MAGFIFENMTQAQASAFTPSDNFIFGTATPAQVSATYAPANGLTVATITVTANGHSLVFPAAAVEGGNVSFADTTTANFAVGTTGLNTIPVDAHNALTIGLVGGTTDAPVSYQFLVAADGVPLVPVTPTNHVIVGNSGDDIVNALGSNGNNIISGGAGSDSIAVGDGNNHIYGNALTSVQGAADGDDEITVGTGSNVINGNAGNDIIQVGETDSTGANRVQGGADDDTITVLGAGVNSINGNKGDDTIDASDATGNNLLRGGQGDDTIWGGTGSDQLLGDAGNDVLHAGSNAGGGSVSVLTGGADEDLFTFVTAAKGANIVDGPQLKGFFQEVTDFHHGEDAINLTFTTSTGGTTPVLTTDFSSVLDANVLHQSSGATFTTEAAAETYAGQLLASHLTAAAGAPQVAAIQVNNDTYLFYSSTATSAAIDSVIKLDGVKASDLHGDTTGSFGDFHVAAV